MCIMCNARACTAMCARKFQAVREWSVWRGDAAGERGADDGAAQVERVRRVGWGDVGEKRQNVQFKIVRKDSKQY